MVKKSEKKEDLKKTLALLFVEGEGFDWRLRQLGIRAYSW